MEQGRNRAKVKGSVPNWAVCGLCGHAWVVAYVPMKLRAFARLIGRACCPACCPACGAASKDLVMYVSGVRPEAEAAAGEPGGEDA